MSIYLSTTRISTDWQADRLRFRAALDRARELLTADYDPSSFKPLVEELEKLLPDQDFWIHQGDGLAVFGAPGFARTFRLPVELPELVVVGPNFHTRPLVQLLQAPDRYWILSLSQNDVALWSGDSSGVRRVDPKGVPRSLREAVGQYMDYEPETFHSSLGAGLSPVYHGHGAGMDGKDWEVEAFVRKVDQGLRELLEPDDGPLLLAAVEEYHSLYRSVSQLKNLAAEGIRGNVSSWAPERLHRAAWPLVEKSVARRIDEALQLWESAYGLKKVESDLSASARLAVAGRVRLLMTDRDRKIWGHLDRATGAVEIVADEGSDPGGDAVELLDELAEVVILHAGRALALPGDRMPTGTGLATVLR